MWIRFWPLYILLVAFAIGFLMGEARPHSSPWGMQYPSDCCSKDGKECDPVPESAIKETRNGYLITLHPGEHKNVKTLSTSRLFDYRSAEVKLSSDGHVHACVGSEYSNQFTGETSKARIWCVIVVPKGF